MSNFQATVFFQEHPGKREIFDGLAHMYRSYYENEWSAPVEEVGYGRRESEIFSSRFQISKNGTTVRTTLHPGI